MVCGGRRSVPRSIPTCSRPWKTFASVRIPRFPFSPPARSRRECSMAMAIHCHREPRTPVTYESTRRRVSCTTTKCCLPMDSCQEARCRCSRYRRRRRVIRRQPILRLRDIQRSSPRRRSIRMPAPPIWFHRMPSIYRAALNNRGGLRE